MKNNSYKLNYSAAVILSALFFCDSAFSAVEIEVVNERFVDEEKHKYTIKGIYDDVKVHYTFHTDHTSEVTSGTSLISLDDGETFYIIAKDEDSDMNEKICLHTTSVEVSNLLGKYLLKITGRYNVKMSNPVVAKVFEKKSEDIHGLKTRNVRLKTTFNTSYDFLFFNDNLKVERILDVWLTPKISGINAKPLLQHVWKATGFPQMDEALKGTTSLLKGYRLRSALTQTVTDKKGEAVETKITTFVKSIKTIKKLPSKLFEIPTCTKVGSSDMEKSIEHMLFVISGKPL